MALMYLHRQKSQGFKSKDLGGLAVGNCRLMILMSRKWRQSSCFKQRAMCGGASSCINTIVVSHHLAWRARITDSFNKEEYRWLVMVYLSLPVVWNKCAAAISLTTKSSAGNFLQLGLLNPSTWILATFGCGVTSRLLSTVIESLLYPILKKA